MLLMKAMKSMPKVKRNKPDRLLNSRMLVVAVLVVPVVPVLDDDAILANKALDCCSICVDEWCN